MGESLNEKYRKKLWFKKNKNKNKTLYLSESKYIV